MGNLTSILSTHPCDAAGVPPEVRAMLDRAALLHDAYHLVLFDFRNHGQSGATATTQGVREARDLRAVLASLSGEAALAAAQARAVCEARSLMCDLLVGEGRIAKPSPKSSPC